MRDGKSLAGDIYIPDGTTGTVPAILVQTPYNKLNARLIYTGLTQNPLFQSNKFAWVWVDWRGFFGSTAAFVSQYPRGDDGYDLVQWISQQSWCNGNVGSWGPSALGTQQYKTLERQPPNLKASVPMVGNIADSYELAYPGGVYFENRNEFVQSYYYPTPIFKNNPLKNIVWQTLANAGNASGIATAPTPILIVAGWFDINIEINIRDFELLNRLVPSPNKPKMIIGPWSHENLGNPNQGGWSFPAAAFADSLQVIDFFSYYLTDNKTSDYPNTYPSVRYWRMGSEVFASTNSWPPATSTPTTFYLLDDATLSTTLSVQSTGSRFYTSDPTNPMKTKFGRILNETGFGLQGAGDLSDYLTRSDAIVYTTGNLPAPVTVDGNITLSLWVSIETVGVVDTDVHVRLLHHYPNGSAVGLVDGVRRLSLRNGYTTRQLLPNTHTTGPYLLEISMMPTSLTIPAGHALLVLLGSSNNNQFELNYQDGSNHITDSGASPLVGRIQIWANTTHASKIVLPIVYNSQSGSPNAQPAVPGVPSAQPALETRSGGIPSAGLNAPVSQASQQILRSLVWILCSLFLLIIIYNVV